MVLGLTRKNRRAARKNLKRVLEIFGPNGEHWIKGQWTDHNGNYCLIGAIDKANGEGEAAAKLAIKSVVPGRKIVAFNDSRAKSFADIRRVVEKALRSLGTD